MKTLIFKVCHGFLTLAFCNTALAAQLVSQTETENLKASVLESGTGQKRYLVVHRFNENNGESFSDIETVYSETPFEAISFRPRVTFLAGAGSMARFFDNPRMPLLQLVEGPVLEQPSPSDSSHQDRTPAVWAKHTRNDYNRLTNTRFFYGGGCTI